MGKEKITTKIVGKEKVKMKKKVKKALKKAIFCFCGGVFLLGTGYFLGVHHRAIAAYVKGEELPTPPKGHFCH